VNDTVVVSDRIRENLHKEKKKSLGTIINESLNQTLSRTLLTGGTTFFVLLTLFYVGGGVIHGFAFTLLVGLLIGLLFDLHREPGGRDVVRARRCPDRRSLTCRGPS
jgi:preprotein translocase SecF subunit